MDYYNKIIKDYEICEDLIVKEINKIYIIYLESLVDQTKVNDYILKQLVNNNSFNINKIPSPNVKKIKDYQELLLYLNSGFTIILNEDTYAIETKSNLSRAIDTPNTEATIFGPKDSLTENYQINLGLIKRRIKSANLKNKTIYLGRYTTTLSSILYIDTITKIDTVKKIEQKLKKIDIDGINDITELKKYLNDENKNVFPSIKLTERPDVITEALLEGKVVILLDNSPYALILPAFLVDFINPISDRYIKSININFLKILRFFCFFLSIILPAFYIAITTYNQETIPSNLLINFQKQRIDVPFPAFLECILTLLICEILRESDVRFPSNYGSAISILGALVLGEAAVSAGFVSPIMIIIVAITFISSLLFTDLEIINAIRAWRIIFLLLSAIYGLYGVGIAFIFFIINITSYTPFNLPYFYPISPFDLTYIKETIFKMKNNKRSKVLSNNITKGNL